MEKILVATDLSARSDRAVLRAAQLAGAKGAALRIVHVVDDDLPAAMLQTRTEEVTDALEAMVAQTPALSELSPEISIEAGHIDVLLPKVAAEYGADLLVVGGHRNRGMAELLGTPTLVRLVRGTELPVLVVTGRPEAPYAAVSVAWDFSPAARIAGLTARALAPDAALTLVHAWVEPYGGSPYGIDAAATMPAAMRQRLETKIAGDAAELGGDPVPGQVIVIGPPGHVLRRRAVDGEADLLALGRHARSGLARFLLGATAEDVALTADCDVLIAPPE
ncbi:universal stress protein [Jannaschia seohaensis]|uniref:Nucleotide-binding universal stress UspA family protein n=1 Tax=Jannaschia seohaensis TaxID=475081 RepID=A0A2Y9AUR8_9RHOB|nr:universal stress protein [Jannaschia seohaensis]PWJ19307.1 nucleotide-binding universal stress UspA family protein [Jannaschia seohaensis]SSA45969.1 Nucleotide-binding universal stress protein, UspA family [Jannaschia seohaensis]